MSHTERALLNLLKERSFQRGTFKLASGETSDYYVDGKNTQVFSEGAYLIGEVIYEHTRELDIDAIGGLEIGAIPLTTAAVIAYHHHGRKIEGFWVRDKAKDHGTKKIIEGKLAPGARVVIVDDVFTTGGSAKKAAAEVKIHGGEVVLVLALVDRLRGAETVFSGQGMAYRAIFTIRDFGVEVEPSRPNELAVG
jgi:orotate phosphoribosyltransferase